MHSLCRNPSSRRLENTRLAEVVVARLSRIWQAAAATSAMGLGYQPAWGKKHSARRWLALLSYWQAAYLQQEQAVLRKETARGPGTVM